MFSCVSPEGLLPANHPLRAVRPLVNAALRRLSPRFDKIHAPSGRGSIAPERLLRALLLQALSSVRPERQLMEQIPCDMMSRWFVGLSMDAPVWAGQAARLCHVGGAAQRSARTAGGMAA